MIRPFGRALSYAPAVAGSFLAFAQPAQAELSNSAVANGTYGATPIASAPSTVDIPVVTANPNLTVVKSLLGAATTAGGSNGSFTDAGDTITYQYVIQNTGNVTINDVTPVDAGPTFTTLALPGTGTMGSFTLVSASDDLLPGQTATFTAIYTLSAVDVYRVAGISPATNAINNTATATGTPVSGTLGSVAGSTVSTTITAAPLLTVSKVGVLVESNGNTTDGRAEANDVINYTYTVSNTGNTAVTGIVVNDTHEGSPLATNLFSEGGLVDGSLASASPPTVSSDFATNGSWDVLQPGAMITFTYAHTVTQAEIDGG